MGLVQGGMRGSDLRFGRCGGCGGPEDGSTWSPGPSAVTRAADLTEGGSDYTTEGKLSASRVSDAIPQVVCSPRQAAFTTTKVPWFDGTTSWE